MKTMKKLCLLFALFAMLALCACGEESAPETNEATTVATTQVSQTEQMSQDTTQTTEAQNDDNQNDEIPNSTPKYESDLLVPYGATAQVADSFVAFADDGQKMLLTADGKLLNTQTLEGDFWFAANAEPSEILCIWNEAAYVENDVLYLWANNHAYPCYDIRGEIFYYAQLFSGDLAVCSRDEDGKLYYNQVEKTGNKSEFDNAELFLYDFRTKTYYDRVDYIRFVMDDIQPNLYAEIDGIAFYCNVPNLNYFDGKQQIWLDTLYGTPEAENVVDYGYGGAQSPLYKKTGDNTALYYMYGYSGDELPIFMPEGKTVENLTQVIFGDVTYLLFDDGSVYAAQLVNTVVGPKFELDSTLTELNEQGAIVQIYRSTYLRNQNCVLRILMDDNVTYEYHPAK